MVPQPLVETKLFRPPLRPGVVARRRLEDRRHQAIGARLTLVSAPAGFGKTTLLSHWASTAGDDDQAIAWVSLDEDDRDPRSLWTCLLTALERAVPGSASSALALLQSGAGVTLETVVATVLNELSVLPTDLMLVLDDYHRADGPDVAGSMTYLLEHLPPQVHLVISTRADPALPLARWRARGELVEVRASDLRFTVGEAAAYLNGVGSLTLEESQIAALEARTEGWIAALQLAALSLQGRDDVSGFIDRFSGDDRYVVDYLASEVLDHQRPDIRGFLLATSILDRLCGPLCEAVTARPGGKAMLEALDRANLFLVPLDDHRRWYRYHHLFADVLRAHLLEERPQDLADLHRRASRWFASAGEPEAAVRHALAAGDIEEAAGLVETAMPALQRDRREATLVGWIDDIPHDVVRVRPVLAIGFVGALMSSGRPDGVEGRLDEIARLLESPADMVVVDQSQLPRVAPALEMYRAALALTAGDVSATVSHADAAIGLADAGDHLVRSAAAALSGLASWSSGDLDAAHRGYSVAMEGLERAGHISDVLGCAITLADIEITQGRLTDALHTFERAVDLNTRVGTGVRGVPDMYVGMSRIACERNDLAGASAYLEQSERFGDEAGLPQNAYRWRVAMARIRTAQGDLPGALGLLEEAERAYVGDYSPNVQPVAAMRARVLAAHGDVSAAARWAQRQGLAASDEPTYLHEYEHLTLVRVLLAQHALGGPATAPAEALGLVERVATSARRGGRVGSEIEALVLKSLACNAMRDLRAATDALEQALTMAEPEGYVRTFIGEGAPVIPLLQAVSRSRPGWAYPRRLLGASAGPPAARADSAARPSGGLLEPLSERELDVLRLLASDLDGPAIARELVVSLNTVRTHTKHIYTKLGVNSRRAAVRQAHLRGITTAITT